MALTEQKLTAKQIDQIITHKILSLIGFATKAGKLVMGTDKICDEIRRHGMPSDDNSGYSTCGIVIIASDASDNTKKRITNACTYYRVEVYRSKLTQEQLADMIGKSSAAACATFDRGFADGIRNAISLKHLPKSAK